MEDRSGYSAKVAIPRLKRTDQQIASSSKPPRVRTETVNKACTRCRKRKTKCSGTRPRCTNCEKQDELCVYEQPRRDRLRDALHKVDLLTTMLRDVRLDLSGEQGKKIDDTLQQLEDDTPPSTPSVLARRSMDKRPRSSSSDETEHNSQVPDEYHVSASVGSNEDLDFLDENLLEDEGPSETGYMGRNSQVQWMRTLQRKLDQPKGEPDMSYAPPGGGEEAIGKRSEALHQRQHQSGRTKPLQDFYFYLDNNNIDDIDNTDPYIVPPLETAEKLFEFYLAAVHTPFRILDDDFESQLRTYYQMEQHSGAVNVCVKWKAILNLVFAIGARFSHLVGAEWRADNRDHLIYMSRAVHFLGLRRITTLVCAPDKYLIQATGLFSFYYLTIGHVSRAWYMIGISLRHAQAAGLHLRNEDLSVPLSRKKAMAQTWWALHSIECILTSITGRPRVIYQKDCTVPLLTCFTEGNSNVKKPKQDISRSQSKHSLSVSSIASGHDSMSFESTGAALDSDLFLSAWTELDIIQHKALTNLYSARTATKSWKHMQREISSLITELDKWVQQTLPPKYFSPVFTGEHLLQRNKLLLFFYYQSVNICITRPCLCRLDRRIKGQSEESAKFNQRMANVCVQAALDLTSWLSEPTNPQWLYEKGPWWSNVHIIMQAITVLLLEITQGPDNSSKMTPNIMASVEKLVQCLRMMRMVDGVAERAYSIVIVMLSKHEKFAGKIVPSQWLQETMHPFGDKASTSNMASQMPHNVNPQYFPETTWPPMSINDDYYSTANAETFDFNTLTLPPNDPDASFPFNQAQYPLFYGNQFTTLYDQNMNFEYSDDNNMNSWGAMDEE